MYYLHVFMHILCCLVAQSRPSGKFLCPGTFPDKNTGADCHFLLQGRASGVEVGVGGGGLPHLVMEPVSPTSQADCLPLSHPGSAYMYICAVLR